MGDSDVMVVEVRIEMFSFALLSLLVSAGVCGRTITLRLHYTEALLLPEVDSTSSDR